MVRTGLIGIGRWGNNYLRLLPQISNFVGFADTDVDKAELATHGLLYNSNYEDLLPLVDAVCITTPSDTHYEIARKCLEEGKHVLVEKPLTLDSKTSLKLCEIAEKKGVILATGAQYRFNPATIWLKNELANMGTLHNITMRYIHGDKPPRKDMGVIFNFAIHLFDILNFTLQQLPEKIYCKKVNYLSADREDCTVIVADYGEFYTSLECTWFHGEKARDCWVIASNDRIHIDFLRQWICHYDKEGDDIVERPIVVLNEEPLKNELMHFVDCIANKRTPINSGRAGYDTVKLCEIALKSAKQGKEIEI